MTRVQSPFPDLDCEVCFALGWINSSTYTCGETHDSLQVSCTSGSDESAFNAGPRYNTDGTAASAAGAATRAAAAAGPAAAEAGAAEAAGAA